MGRRWCPRFDALAEISEQLHCTCAKLVICLSHLLQQWTAGLEKSSSRRVDRDANSECNTAPPFRTPQLQWDDRRVAFARVHFLNDGVDAQVVRILHLLT